MSDTQESPVQQELTNTAPVDSGETTQVELESEASTKETENASSVETAEDDSDTDSDTDTEGRKSGKGFEKRIERFNRRIAEKEAEIEHWKKAALQGQSQQSTPQPVQVQPTAKPTIEQFGTNLDAYVEAVSDWKYAENKRQEAANAQHAEFQKRYAEQEKSLKSSNPDYQEVIQEFRDKYKNVNAPDLNLYLQESDQSAALYWYLAQNHSEVDRILALSPVRRVAELGKMEAKLGTVGSAPSKAANTVSKAPKPVTPVTGASPTTKTLQDYAKDDGKSQAEYRALRMQSLKKKY